MQWSRLGFSLIEVLIASLILVIGIIGLMPAFNSGMKGNTRAEMWTQAGLLAQRKIEELKRGVLSASSGTEGKYHWKVAESDLDLPYQDRLKGLKRYELLIWWKDGERIRRERFVYVKKVD